MLKAKILGQLLLMQSIVYNLPDKKSIFSFVCKGLLDIPGIEKVDILEKFESKNNPKTIVFSLKGKNHHYCDIVIKLSNTKDFKPYNNYLKNFIVMIELILEERYQRELNEKHKRELENSVKKRTKELSYEIEQRQHIEASLKKTEELFSTSFENKTSGVCLVSIQGKFLKANAKLCRILGYPLNELLQKTFNELTHPDDVLVGKKAVFDLLSGKKEYADFEKRYIHKNGKTIYAHVSSALVKNYLDEPEYFITYVQDITEQKIINEALRTIEYNYQSLFENMTVGFAFHKMIYDSEGNSIDYQFITINKAFELLTGQKAENIIGKTALECQPGINQQLIDFFGSVAKTGIAKNYENYTEETDTYYEGKAYSPKKDHFAVMFSDITKRKKAELSIRENEEKFRSFFENINEASALHKIICDDNNVPVDFEYIEVNPVYEQLTKLRAKDIIGKRGTEVIPELEQRWIDLYGRVALTGQSVSIIDHSEYLDRYWDIKAFCPKPGYFAIAMTDVTEQINNNKKLEENENSLKEQNFEYEILNEELKQINEELLKAKERAEESDHLKSAFLANMSHEIRTPMNGMIGFANLINKPDITEEQRKKYAEIIQDSCLRLLNIVNDIVDISIIETGQIKLNVNKFNLNQVLRELLNFYLPVSRKNQFDLSTQMELDDDEAWLETDRVKLTQIINNLLSNAIKFTHSGHVKFGYKLKTAFLEIFVEDTGIGIANEEQNLIFERFQQARVDKKIFHSGTGLGLAIAKAYAKKLGGEIRVDSTVGKGSTFYLTIPFRPTFPELAKQTGVKTIDKNKLTVLIVEDEEYNYLLLQEYLLPLNYKLIRAINGAETISAIHNAEKIDLILMDIKLPDCDGYELTKNVKQLLPNVPVIAQTAHALEGESAKALNAGCDNYISKPFLQNDLLVMINKHTKIKT